MMNQLSSLLINSSSWSLPILNCSRVALQSVPVNSILYTSFVKKYFVPGHVSMAGTTLSARMEAFQNNCCPASKKIEFITGIFQLNAGFVFGNDLIDVAPKIIGVEGYIQLFDLEAAMFLTKHEFSHLKHYDDLRKNTVHFVANTVAALFCNSVSNTLLVQGAVHFISCHILERYHEYQADTFAIEHATEEELKGGVRFFTAMTLAEEELKGGGNRSLQCFLNCFGFLILIHKSGQKGPRKS